MGFSTSRRQGLIASTRRSDDEHEGESMEINAGEALIWNGGLWHAAVANHTMAHARL